MIRYPRRDLAGLRPRQHQLVVGGSRTRCWAYGPSDASHLLVLVHGFRGDHHGMEPLVAELSDCRVIVPDLPGFGGSAPFEDREHTVESFATWLAALVDELGDTAVRTSVIGHSFGSVITAAALAGGLSADSAILINPLAARALDGPRKILSRWAIAYYRLGARLPEPVGARLLGSRLVVRGVSVLMAKTHDRELRRWIHDQHRRHFSCYADRRVVLEAFTASVGHDVGEYASALDLPVLLLGGERDDITSSAAHHRLAERLPDGRLVMIPGVGHLIHYEAPRRAARAITDFIRIA